MPNMLHLHEKKTEGQLAAINSNGNRNIKRNGNSNIKLATVTLGPANE
jgi:hypothetical protein